MKPDYHALAVAARAVLIEDETLRPVFLSDARMDLLGRAVATASKTAQPVQTGNGRITRDANVPQEMSDLFQMMNAVADGYSLEIVQNAAINFLSATIHNGAAMLELPPDQVGNYMALILNKVAESVQMNIAREAGPTDIPVGEI